MKNRKINVDRPRISSKEIQAGMNFSALMVNHQAMSKPFYKTGWFFGTTGLASIGLIVGGTFAFQSGDESENEKLKTNLLTDAPPPEVTASEDNLLALNTEPATQPLQETPGTKIINFKKQEYIDETPTTKVKEDENTTVIAGPAVSDNLVQTAVDLPEKTTGEEIMDLEPRINGKMNGDITREDLFDNKGITTGTDVSIIHFELHLIDGLGGKVFEEESNQLNQEMRTALHNIGKGETIYFEDIRGRTSDGRVVRLNPLRFVLLD